MLLPFVGPGSFLPFNQSIESGVQRSRDAHTLRFARNRATQEIDFRFQFVTDVVQHGRWMVRLRADFVHLPRIFVELDAQAGSNLLAFINERVQQMAQIGEVFFCREMDAVRQLGQRGNGVDRSIKDEFGPLCRPRIWQRHGLKARRVDQLGGFLNDSEWRIRRFERTHPSRGVEFVLYVRVAVARAAHERGSANHEAACEVRDNFLATEPVLRGKDSAFLEEMSDWPHRLRSLRRLAGNDAQIEFRRQARWVMRGMELGVKLMRSGNFQTVAIQLVSVLRAANKSPYLRDFGQVRGVEASNRAASDNANAFDQLSNSRTRGSLV